MWIVAVVASDWNDLYLAHVSIALKIIEKIRKLWKKLENYGKNEKVIEKWENWSHKYCMYVIVVSNPRK